MIDPPRQPGAGPQPVRLAHATLQETVALWWCSLDHPPGTAECVAPWLSSAERQRAARFGTSTLRERYIIGRATLRQLLSEALRVPPEQVPIVRGPRGRPMLEGTRELDFNVSHTGGIAVFALGVGLPHGWRVGVDVERRTRRPDVVRLARKVLAGPERRALLGLSADDQRSCFLALWTCKEAMSKATGDGLRAPFGKIEIEVADLPRLVAGPPPYTPGRWQLHRVAMAGDCLLSVALHQTS